MRAKMWFYSSQFSFRCYLRDVILNILNMQYIHNYVY